MTALSENEHLRIGQLAAQLRLNPKTIRYYEDIGLLQPAQRTPAGYRIYGAADRDRLQFVGKAKALGLTLGEIRQILTLRDQGEAPCRHVLALLDYKLAAIDHQLRVLDEFRQDLLRLRWSAVEALPSDRQVCGIIEQHPYEHVEDGDRPRGA
ncbi:MAG TPA: heavy metal-responsive transcriptional regulator [Herpetosiphonaceae bacterium]|nr:heavy metal-responsive transcriptional regulator [Herpetosiphonaceae bacterium]